ncbi:hypothetical protein [Mycobacterium uberis]
MRRSVHEAPMHNSPLTLAHMVAAPPVLGTPVVM